LPGPEVLPASWISYPVDLAMLRCRLPKVVGVSSYPCSRLRWILADTAPLASDGE